MEEDTATEAAAKVLYENLLHIGLVSLSWDDLEPEDQDMFSDIVGQVITEYDSNRDTEDID